MAVPRPEIHETRSAEALTFVDRPLGPCIWEAQPRLQSSAPRAQCSKGRPSWRRPLELAPASQSLPSSQPPPPTPPRQLCRARLLSALLTSFQLFGTRAQEPRSGGPDLAEFSAFRFHFGFLLLLWLCSGNGLRTEAGHLSFHASRGNAVSLGGQGLRRGGRAIMEAEAAGGCGFAPGAPGPQRLSAGLQEVTGFIDGF